MSHYINERGQLVIDDRDRPKQVPTLRNIREGLLIALYTNPPECQWTNEARWLQQYLMLPSGEDAGERRRRLVAALDSVGYDQTLMQTIRHYVRERFGEWDPGIFTAVHDWLVACHGFSAEAAWEVRAPELLALLKKNAAEQGVEETRTSTQQPPKKEDIKDRPTEGCTSKVKNRKTAKKTRNRKPRTVELLLVLLEDRTKANLNYSELADELGVHVSSVSRAFKHPKYGPELVRRYHGLGVPPPRSHQV